MALVDVVVPTFNNVRELLRCLASLERQTVDDIRILVCVDGSTDGTLEQLSAWQGQRELLVTRHPGAANRGRAATRNLALAHLTARYILFLDSDMELEPDGIEGHVELLRTQPLASVGAVAYRNASTNLWTRYISARRLNRYRDRALLPFSQFTTANLAIRAGDFETLRGFDERIVDYGGEDSEFGYRLSTELRRPIVANQAARATSEEWKTLSDALAQLETYGRTNLRYLHEIHPEMPHVFHTDKLLSRRLVDRLFVATLNPLTDGVVRALLPLMPFAVQHQLINYLVIRAVCRGYAATTGRAAERPAP